jgi:hypothetical protein
VHAPLDGLTAQTTRVRHGWTGSRAPPNERHRAISNGLQGTYHQAPLHFGTFGQMDVTITRKPLRQPFGGGRLRRNRASGSLDPIHSLMSQSQQAALLRRPNAGAFEFECEQFGTLRHDNARSVCPDVTKGAVAESWHRLYAIWLRGGPQRVVKNEASAWK